MDVEMTLFDVCGRCDKPATITKYHARWCSEVCAERAGDFDTLTAQEKYRRDMLGLEVTNAYDALLEVAQLIEKDFPHMSDTIYKSVLVIQSKTHIRD